MSDIRSGHIQGDFTISSSVTDTGTLHVDLFEEATSSAGIFIASSILKVGNGVNFTNDTAFVTRLDLADNGNSNIFSVTNNAGPIDVFSKGGKGISISETTGNVLITGTADSVDEFTGSLITNGGAVIGKTLNVKEDVNGLNGLHKFTNTTTVENVMDIKNTSTSGHSSIYFKDTAGTSKLELGYGNSLVAAPLASVAYIQSKGGSELFFRGDATDSFKIATNGSLTFYSTIASTSSSTGALKIQGGVGISNATDATSSTNGGSLTTTGGVAIAKKLFVGGQVDVGSNKIVSLLDPTQPQDAATKYYVDLAAGGTGIIIKASVILATTSQVTLATGFENGDTLDGIALVTGDRILVKNQTNGVENGIYIVNVSGAPTRASDFLATSSIAGAQCLVENGNINTGSGWLCTNVAGGDVVGTDALIFEKLSTGGEIILAGTGLTKTVSTLSVNASQTQVTGIGTLTVGTWNASTVTVPYGGTGASTLTSTGVLLGNGTSPVAAGVGITYATSTLTLPKIVSNDSTATSSSTTGAVLLSGGLALSNTTDATSSTNGGTITTAGGVAIAKKLFVGTDLSIGGNVTAGTWTASTVTVPYGGTGATTLTSTGVLLGNGTSPVAAGVGITYATSTLTLPKIVSNDSTATTSSTTGAVLLSGGLALANTTDATSSTNGGTITTAGGVAIAKKLFVGGAGDFASYIDIMAITVPAAPSAGEIRLYVDSVDTLLKSRVPGGIVKVYNPNNAKGDLITHDGTTDVRLPRGTLNQILYSDSTLSAGIGWKDLSTETAFTDPFATKYIEVYVSSQQALTDSYTDLLFESVRTSSADVFTRIESNVIKFLQAGTYIIMTRITVDITSGSTDARVTMKTVIDNDDDVYTDIAGSTSSCHCRSESYPTGTTSTFFILDVAANQKLKTQLIRDVGTSTVNTLVNGCNMFIIRPGVDLSDSTKHFNAYTSANLTLTGTFADVSLGVVRQTDSPYTFTAGTAPLTVSENGDYLISYGVGCDKTSGTDRSISESRLMLSDANGANFAQVTGSLSYTYHFDNTYDGITNSRYLCISLVVGQVLKVQSRIFTGTNLRTSIGPTYLGSLKFQSTSSGQTTPNFFNTTNTTNITVTNSYTALTFNTNSLMDADYTHTVSSSEVTVTEEGKYIIFLSYSGEITTTSETVSRIRLEVDNGTGYSEIAGSLSGAYHYDSTVNKNSCTTFVTINMSVNSKIKASAIKAYGSQTLRTVANAINMAMVKIDAALIPVNSLIKFGTFYMYIESLGNTSTNSTTYINKITLTTDAVLEGYYRIGTFYTCASTTNNGEMAVALYQDNILVFENSFVIASNNVNSTSPFYSNKELFLSSGIHTFAVQFKSISGTANIRDTKIEFWRVK